MSTTYTVKNGGPLDKAFKVYGGFAVVQAGKGGEVTTTRPLTEAQIDALARDGVTVTEKAAKKADPKSAEGPRAAHRGGGSYSVMDGDKELVEKLSKEEAEAFNMLDADAKAKFIADRTKA